MLRSEADSEPLYGDVAGSLDAGSPIIARES